jgi:hypothetical protein
LGAAQTRPRADRTRASNAAPGRLLWFQVRPRHRIARGRWVLCAVPLEIIEPTAWKRFWKLPPKDKERSRQRALELFPSAHSLLARKLDHGRAEAALIALYEFAIPV